MSYLTSAIIDEYNETLGKLSLEEQNRLILRVVDRWHGIGNNTDESSQMAAYIWGTEQALAILAGHSVISGSDEYDEIMSAQEVWESGCLRS